ncbi:MAG: cytochrome c [Burkholderiaceae bacterium]
MRLTLVFAAALAAAAPAGARADGAALFAQHCATCHQADGSGTVGLAPPLKGEHWAKLGADRGYLPTVVVHGMSGSIKLGGGQTFVGAMPPLGQQLDDATIAEIATHVRRKLHGAADAPAYTPADVKAAREQPGSPPQTRQRRTQLLG